MAFMGAAVEIHAPSLLELARQVYHARGAVSEDAATELIARTAEAGRLGELQGWAAHELLDRIRVSANKPIYAQAHGLRQALAVEFPPLGYKLPSVDRVAGECGNIAQIRPGEVSAFRVALRLKVRLERHVVQPAFLRKHDILRVSEQLEQQGYGCLRNAELLKALAGHMCDGERGIDTIRRLEREAPGRVSRGSGSSLSNGCGSF